ncbi:putative addiction module antidote protein [Pasteurella atlantica]|uniref:Addiction module antidote protein n=2 Tax=Pasteurellaceae TaxID=712 RepID=A0ACC6HJL0_9PAST|nr:addiction module antidote protein [Pasteurella atlantica]MDP8034409.1 putative addiction module antidote protein [Pasteurella atlantica]MDP8036340.1 putative addiction module antidote protein [Pasteurella atlantica]MDP8038293.1 putative addiction module antidote protein [Pasteurella atlantica]MDP8048647.1 putative addiction module antidote protein [Pasteurella atlantica]MDP8050601.1 putative addiction module antidote protein [Pasteurella atlantica]
MKLDDLKEFDASKYLVDEESIAIYVNEMLESGDLKALPLALGTVSKARNMSELARKTGISRKGLYQALSEDGNPSFDTVLKVMQALNLTFEIKQKQVI